MSFVSSLLGSRQYFCIFCENIKYPSGDKNELILQDVGICGECSKRLYHTGECSSFKGTKNVNYILSPFYYRGTIQNAIRQYKFNGMYKYADVFAHQMIEFLYGFTHFKYYDMIVPVPLSNERHKMRGYNQSTLLVNKISVYFRIPSYENAVVRIRDTQRQSLLKGMSRYENVYSAFKANSDIVSGKRIILLDDIITSACTIEACASALIGAGAKEVVGISLAYTYNEIERYKFM